METADIIKKKCLSTCCSGIGGAFEPHLQFFGLADCDVYMCVYGPSVSPHKQVGVPRHRYQVPLFDNPLQTSLISATPTTHSPSDKLRNFCMSTAPWACVCFTSRD